MKKLAVFLLMTAVITACNTPSADHYIDFLYANMSLPDSIDYSRSYFAGQVETALRARAEMPWGKVVPEREFRHFVLPPRVNNEDLDDFRTCYYDELAARVAGHSMEEAILEVNHWCHEHVTYRPTSARTLGPASTVRTAYGRCGEESVLLVAALRTVGIPARQVYTPRWAHTDDNHAWVEAWADGTWHFLGACEPEPVLDLGWFNESASRGMLMHTKVFGNYSGPEDIVKQEHNLTEINVTANYAPTRRLTVCVQDSAGAAVEGASVEFKLYNYAEFYTVARAQTDADGHCSLTAGLGDMLIWASTSEAIAYSQVSFRRDSLVTLTLQPRADVVALPESTFDIVPPAPSAKKPEVTDEQRAANNSRLAVEDSIRAAYEATMPDQRSRGNHAVIEAFIDSATALGLAALAETLIKILPDKDLQDVTTEVLIDNIQVPEAIASMLNERSDTHEPRLACLLSPRIERERLTPFKATLSKAFASLTLKELITWTRDSLTIVEGRNPQRLRITPLGVFNSRKTDALGRDIFFVAACRSIGVPARINEVNDKVEYLNDEEQWIEVKFEDETEVVAPQGTLRLSFTPTKYVPDAKYYIHFTISRLVDDNRLKLLTYPDEATFDNTFAAGISLDAGTYVLTTGTRMADGSVLTSMQTFDIAEGATTSLPIKLRQSTDAVAVIGALNAEDLYQPLTVGAKSAQPAGAARSLLATCGRGYYVLGIVAPNHEPTNHALRDIALVSDKLENWGRGIVLLFQDQDAAARFNADEFNSLPATVCWGCDIDGTILREAVEQQHLPSASLPIFMICDSFNRVVFVQQGYTIGLGEQLMKVINQL